MDVKICFLILHFKDAALTIRAVESVLKLKHANESKIIIVENGSGNDSGEVLRHKYLNNDTVDVLILENNLGFSKGNNFGYKYIKEMYDPDFVVIMNNDILYPENDFISKLYDSYKSAPFYIAGPDIYVPSQKYHSSPLKRYSVDVIKTDEEIAKNRNVIIQSKKLFSFYMFKRYIKDIALAKYNFLKFLLCIKRLFCGEVPKGWNEIYSDDFVLQGSCLIFDKRFLALNDMAFYPETFLYGEEFFLANRCKINKWNMRYIPTIQVWHTCQGSMKDSYINYRVYCEKQKKSALITIESLKEYRRYIQMEQA